MCQIRESRSIRARNLTVTLLLRTTRMHFQLLARVGGPVWRLHKQTNKQTNKRVQSPAPAWQKQKLKATHKTKQHRWLACHFYARKRRAGYQTAETGVLAASVWNRQADLDVTSVCLLEHWNQMPYRPEFWMKKMRRRQKNLWKECIEGKTYVRKWATGKFPSTESWWVLRPVDVVCKSFRSESSFLNSWINECIN